MRSIQSLLVVAALWGSASAKPEPNPLLSAVRGRKTFSFSQKAVQRSSPWRGPMSMRRAYLKYGLPVPEGIAAAARMAESRQPPGQTSVGVRPVKGDVEYLITVGVGNHNLSLDLDTGSSDLWVFSTLQPTDQRSNRPVQRVYDPEGSKAKQLSGHSWQIRYGDNSGASGRVYLDKVSIGELSVNEQAVEAATTVSRTFTRDNMNDGLIGLAHGKLNTVKPTPQNTWLDNVLPQLAEPVVTCTLKRRAVGTYDFGYIDKGKYRGELYWSRAKGDKGFWDFRSTAYQIGDGPVVQYNLTGIADTGTSLWYLPKNLVELYWKKIPGSDDNKLQGGWIFPCSSTLPDMTLKIGNGMITVPGINLNYQQISITTCFGGLQSDTGMPFSIFGDTFLKGLFVVFEAKRDRKKGEDLGRIGFAHQSHS